MVDKALILALKEQAFDKQRAVIRDKSKRIALHVGRRGAKTTTIVILFLCYALMHDNIRLIFIGLTGETAEQAFLPHAISFLTKVGMVEGVHFSFNKTERLLTFNATGSTISLKGYDVSYKEMDKILGGKCFSVAIDECQSHTQDIEKAILYKIQPAVSDYLPIGGGSIYLLGTSGDFMGNNFWYRLCSSLNHLGWKYYTWLDKENPHMLQAKLMEDAEFEAQYGADFRTLDWYQQQYENKWIISSQRKVYQFSNKNILSHLECLGEYPTVQFLSTATYGLGMDWGFAPDPMAFIVVAYNKQYSNKLYVVEEYIQNEMYPSDIDKKIRQLDKRYHFAFKVADAGAQAKAQVSDLNVNYGQNIMTADKLGKFAHQNTINSDFRAGHILIDPRTCPTLIDQLSNLIWDPVQLNTNNKREEKNGLPNDACDALLYIHFYCRHLWYSEPKPVYIPLTPEEMNLALCKNLISRGKKRANMFDGLNLATANQSSRRYYGK